MVVLVPRHFYHFRGSWTDSGREDIEVCHPGGCSTTTISTPSTSASMTRVVTGTFSPPVAISEVGAARVPAFLMTYWWDCDDELMFLVFNMLEVNLEDSFYHSIQPRQATLAGQQDLAPTPDVLGQRGLPAGVLKE
ncbi:UNVERIFIED_CONTAM: hypothetical protein Sindi_2948100 [Sesamum indicum]